MTNEQVTRQREFEPFTPGPLRSLQHPVPPPRGDYQWVYLWQAPLRAMHWIAVFSIVALIITGFYIGKPYFTVPSENTSPFTLQYVRLVHFVAAATLVMTGVVRVYWLFAGNRFERLPALFPVRPRDWGNLWKMIKFYLFIHPERAPRYLGHHPLQQLTYTLTYVVTLVMVITGLTLFGLANPGGFIFRTTQWVPALVGGLQWVRVVHHVATWFFVIFIPMHIYLSMRAEILEKTGTVSSILSGGRFVPRDEEYIDA